MLRKAIKTIFGHSTYKNEQKNPVKHGVILM